MDREDEELADRTYERRSEILDKFGAEARKAMTKEAIAARKKELLEEKAELRHQASMKFKKRNGWSLAYSKSLSNKGATVLCQQRKLLLEKFPDASSTLTPAEKKEYAAFTKSLLKEVAASMVITDTIITQLCALQYIPRNPRTSHLHPHGTVAYMNGKKVVRYRSAWKTNRKDNQASNHHGMDEVLFQA